MRIITGGSKNTKYGGLQLYRLCTLLNEGQGLNGTYGTLCDEDYNVSLM
jgi:hypothetical protein